MENCGPSLCPAHQHGTLVTIGCILLRDVSLYHISYQIAGRFSVCGSHGRYRTPVQSFGDLVVPREVPWWPVQTLAKWQGHSKVGFLIPSSAWSGSHNFPWTLEIFPWRIFFWLGPPAVMFISAANFLIDVWFCVQEPCLVLLRHL